ncbi:MAG: AMP-binding protein, partial [Leptospiraceae bacterium]|nr:AMP-binding protein [Leptospiraceae bacterium]
NLSFTYKEVWNLSYHLSLNINNILKGKENVISICMEPSPHFVISIIAIWMSGNMYLPIDTSIPKLRIKYQWKDSNTKLILFDITNKKWFDEIDLPFINLDNFSNFLKTNTIIKNNFHFPKKRGAYIIYTSGTTGNPKGVVIEHKGILNFIQSQIPAFKISSRSKMLQYLSVGFDAFLSEMGTTLLCGGEYIFISINEKSNISTLLNLIESFSITHICLPPAILSLIEPIKKPISLRTIIIGGEVTPTKTIQKWCDVVNLINVYGPTEMTVCTHLLKCKKKHKEAEIGKPINNIEEIIIDKDGRESNKGELLLSGPGIYRGYLNDISLNEKKFFNIENKIYYRTGDLVEKKSNGKLVFLGRIDRQIKILGNRTELEEIESHLKKIKGVNNAIVLPKIESSNFLLISFIQKNTNFKINYKRILQKFIPKWMIPKYFIELNRFPLNFNQKIDQIELLKIYDKFIKEKDFKLKKDSILHYLDKKYLAYGNYKLFELSSIERIQIQLELEENNKIILENNDELKLKDLKVIDSRNSLSDVIYKVRELNNIIYNLNIKNSPGSIKFNKTIKEDSILLIGSGGYLGKHILMELMEQTSKRIYIFYRGNKYNLLNKIISFFKIHNSSFKL